MLLDDKHFSTITGAAIMFHDAREFEDGQVIEADIAIAGGGAAGITIARSFIGSSTRVVLIESGGLDFDPDSQELYKGRNDGLPYFDLDATRFRYFGGSTFHSVGRSRPLDPIDFEARPWVPYSGWPISYQEYADYIKPTHAIMQLGEPSYDPGFWEIDEASLLPFDPTLLGNRIWQFSPTKFGQAYREELRRAKNVDVLFQANVVDIATDYNARHVEAFRVATLRGPRIQVRARDYILACGGLENPRLLLASRSVQKEGLGNSHDCVGRYFMEHPHVRTATLITSAPVDDALYSRGFERRGTSLMAHLRIAPELQKRAEVLNWQGQLGTHKVGVTGYAAFRQALRAVMENRWSYKISWDLFRAIRYFDDTIAGLLGRARIKRYIPRGCLYIWNHLEQAPNPDSRVRLDEAERDELGMPRICLDWRLTALERRTLSVIHQTLRDELERTGAAKLELEPWMENTETDWPPFPTLMGGHHHMGTTRMSDDPGKGVVNRDCLVHGIANLYVAGSSVFSTAGCANPTFSVVAMALRLAKHLGAKGV